MLEDFRWNSFGFYFKPFCRGVCVIVFSSYSVNTKSAYMQKQINIKA